MKNLRLFILTLVSIFLLMACKGEQSGGNASLIDKCSVIATREVNEAGDTVVVCDLAKVKEKVVMPLSLLVDSLELIRLENIDTAIVGDNIANIEITNHYIGINSWYNYKLFTRHGKYVTDIGRQGQGPGEYSEIYYSYIDEKHQRIGLVSWMATRILMYDLKGNYLGEDIPLAYQAHCPVIDIDFSNQQVTIIQSRWQGSGEIPVIWVQDFKGNILQSNYMKQLDKEWMSPEDQVSCGRIAPGTGVMDFFVYSNFPHADTLYHYKRTVNYSIPRFTLLPYEAYLYEYFEFPRFYGVRVREFEGKNSYPNNFAGYLLIDKSTLKGAQVEFVADNLGGFSIPLKYKVIGNYHYFVFCLEPGLLQMLLEERLQHKNTLQKKNLKEIVKLVNSISENDNNYLLLGKWK